MIGRLAHAFARLELILSNVTLAMLVLVLILQVVFRYGLQTGLTWSEEVSRFAFIWFVYLSGVFHRPVPADGLDLHHHSGSACADDLTHPGAAVELLAPRGSDHRGGTGVG